tara:strand:+ start:57 stop:260 length:204 start_codon:yes stop_codon:yes gene_type:complete
MNNIYNRITVLIVEYSQTLEPIDPPKPGRAAIDPKKARIRFRLQKKLGDDRVAALVTKRQKERLASQ